MDYTFTLSLKDVQTIYTALGEMPLKVAAECFGKLTMQMSAQDKERAKKQPTPPAAT